jgi:hypothetical protein
LLYIGEFYLVRDPNFLQFFGVQSQAKLLYIGEFFMKCKPNFFAIFFGAQSSIKLRHISEFLMDGSIFFAFFGVVNSSKVLLCLNIQMFRRVVLIFFKKFFGICTQIKKLKFFENAGFIEILRQQ